MCCDNVFEFEEKKFPIPNLVIKYNFNLKYLFTINNKDLIKKIEKKDISIVKDYSKNLLDLFLFYKMGFELYNPRYVSLVLFAKEESEEINLIDKIIQQKLFEIGVIPVITRIGLLLQQ